MEGSAIIRALRRSIICLANWVDSGGFVGGVWQGAGEDSGLAGVGLREEYPAPEERPY